MKNIVDEIMNIKNLRYYDDPNSIDEDDLFDYCIAHDLNFGEIKNELELRNVNLI